MRCIKLTLALLGFAAILCAADPIVGTWKMNPAKTKYTSGTAPKEQTAVISESGSDLMVKVDGVAADGSKISLSYTVPTAGGKGKIEAGAAYDGISAKRISDAEREMAYMKGGKSVYTTHSTLGADGKTLTVHAKGTNILGKVVEGDVVYDRQK